MDRPRACHTEGSKSEREKQIHINAYMYVESRKKLYRLTYLQSRNRHTDVENKRMDNGKKGWDGLGD